MSITDELRDCIRTANRSYEDVRNPYNDREILHIPEEELLAIADRIDERIEREYVKLPVDADGVPIHVGDELVDEKDRPVKVRVLKLRENGWLFDSSRDCGGMLTTPFRHVQPDSWERIIEDAIDTAFEGVDDESEFDLKKMELVDRCRRLAGAE